MKKLIAVLMAIAMIAALSVTAFAAAETLSGTEGNVPADKEITVTGTYNDQYVQEYHVALTWGSMAFTYNTQVAAWNESTHLWETSGEAGWTCDENANKITLVNHSSQNVTATFEYETTVSIDGTFASEDAAWNGTENKMVMPVQVNPDPDADTAYEGVTTYTVTLTLDNNDVPAEDLNAGTVGTITISFS